MTAPPHLTEAALAAKSASRVYRWLGVTASVIVISAGAVAYAFTHFQAQDDAAKTDMQVQQHETRLQTLEKSEAVQDDKLEDIHAIVCGIAKKQGVVTSCP